MLGGCSSLYNRSQQEIEGTGWIFFVGHHLATKVSIGKLLATRGVGDHRVGQ